METEAEAATAMTAMTELHASHMNNDDNNQDYGPLKKKHKYRDDTTTTTSIVVPRDSAINDNDGEDGAMILDASIEEEQDAPTYNDNDKNEAISPLPLADLADQALAAAAQAQRELPEHNFYVPSRELAQLLDTATAAAAAAAVNAGGASSSAAGGSIDFQAPAAAGQAMDGSVASSTAAGDTFIPGQDSTSGSHYPAAPTSDYSSSSATGNTTANANANANASANALLAAGIPISSRQAARKTTFIERKRIGRK
jgi:hypothetical protein